MFEAVFRDDASTRLRAAGVPPLAAFLAALGYLTIYPMLGRVPAALFWSVVVILVVGAIAGALNIIRVLRSEKVRGRAFGWLAGSAALTLACAWSAVSMTFPWLL